ncbi:MAG: InlB B-repeat-containing protein, partial [Firmicutes bacterium]|nr:InlB B-repeat-containing protein [Bacillota bacterium]
LQGPVTISGELTATGPIRLHPYSYELGYQALAGDADLVSAAVAKFVLIDSPSPDLIINSGGRIDTEPSSLITDGASFVAALGGRNYATYTESGGVYTVTLRRDVVRTRQLYLVSGTYILKGNNTISRASDYTGTVIEISGDANLTLAGNVVVDGGAIWTKDGAYASPADGGANSGVVATSSLIRNAGTFTLTDHATLQNNAAENSNNHDTRAIYSDGDDGLVTISGGVIRDCAASYCAALFIQHGGLHMSGGEICGCKATYDGSGGLVSAAYAHWNIVISGGSVHNNDCQYCISTDGNKLIISGGEFYENSGTVFFTGVNSERTELSGGTFRDNGGAVYALYYKPLYLSGAPVFQTETDFLQGPVVVTGTLTGETPIYLTPYETTSGAVAVQGTDSYALTEADAEKFILTNAPEDARLLFRSSDNQIVITYMTPVLIELQAADEIRFDGEPIAEGVDFSLSVFTYENGEKGEEITANYTPGGGDLGVFYQYRPASSSGSFTEGLPTAAGTYTVQVQTSADNLHFRSAGTATFTLEILPRLVDFTLSSLPDVYYRGSVYTPEPEVSAAGIPSLVKGQDYELLYTDNLIPGLCTVTASGLGNYAGSTGTTTFQILEVPVLVTASGKTGVRYDGNPVVPGEDFTVRVYLYPDHVQGAEITSSYSGENGAPAITYQFRPAGSSGAFSDGLPTDAGTYLIQVQAGADELNYRSAGQATFTLEILPRVTTFTVSPLPDVYYSGSAYTPEPEVAAAGFSPLVKGQDYELRYSNNLTPGTCTVTASGLGNFAGSTGRTTFRIQEIPVLIECQPAEEIRYDGDPVAEGVDFSLSVFEYADQVKGREITDSYIFGGGSLGVSYQYRPADSTGSFTDGLPSATGSYTIQVQTVADNQNYHTAGQATFTLEILPRLVTFTLSALPDVYYSGSAYTPVPEVTAAGISDLVKGRDYELLYADNLTPGTCTVTASGLGNYAGSTGSTTFRIREIPVLITGEAKSGIRFDGNPVAPGEDFTVRVYLYPDNVQGAEITGNYTGTNGAPAITYQYRPSASSGSFMNGLPTDPGTYAIRASATADPARYYGSAETTFSLTIDKAYTVTWQNGASVLEIDENQPLGTMPSYDGATPEKPATAQYSYTFAGWAAQDGQETGTATESLPPVSGDTVYYAAFRKTVNLYPVTFTDGVGNVLKTQDVPYGGAASAPPDPQLEGFTFLGWDSSFTNITGPLTVNAIWENLYTVTFETNGGTEVAIQAVRKGNQAVRPDDPVKEPCFPFGGWYRDAALTVEYDFTAAVTENLILYAKWDESHTPDAAVRENVKAATCTAAGSYEEVVYCSVCGSELSRETKTIAALGHTWRTPAWTWTGYTKAVATFTCDRDSSHTKKLTATITSKVTKEATPTTAGTRTYTATVKLDGKTYTSKQTETIPKTAVTLAAKNVTVSNAVYNGTAQKPAVVKDGTKTLKEGTDYTATYKANTDVGTATVTVTGKGAYSGTVTKTFKITAANVKTATVSGLTAKTYNGTMQKPAPAVKMTLSGKTVTLKSGTDYTVTYKNNKNAGTATVTVTGKGNFTGSKSATFKINAANIKNATIGAVKDQIFDGNAKTPAPAVKMTLSGKAVA